MLNLSDLLAAIEQASPKPDGGVRVKINLAQGHCQHYWIWGVTDDGGNLVLLTGPHNYEAPIEAPTA